MPLHPISSNAEKSPAEPIFFSMLPGSYLSRDLQAGLTLLGSSQFPVNSLLGLLIRMKFAF